MCLVNFLPSTEDFWVFGNTIYRDYYVYHSPDTNTMGWVPTVERFKTKLNPAPVPTTPIEFQYDIEAAYVKGVTAIGIIAATVLSAIFVFTTSFQGIPFINRTSRETTGVKSKAALVKKIESMSTESLHNLLEAT